MMGSKKPSRSRAFARCAILVACLASASVAQEVVSRQDEQTLQERERGEMHPGVPLRLAGIAEGGNDFRVRTPALENSDKAVVKLDPEELRRRRLALYAGGEFHQAPPTREVRRAAMVASEMPAKARGPRPMADPADDRTWILLIPLGALVVGWFLYRNGLFGNASSA